MNKSNISSIQRVVIIVAVIYVFAPDLFIGPIDDAAVAAIAAIAEVVLGIIKSATSPATITSEKDDVA